jgi:hypothetical protein
VSMGDVVETAMARDLGDGGGEGAGPSSPFEGDVNQPPVPLTASVDLVGLCQEEVATGPASPVATRPAEEQQWTASGAAELLQVKAQLASANARASAQATAAEEAKARFVEATAEITTLKSRNVALLEELEALRAHKSGAGTPGRRKLPVPNAAHQTTQRRQMPVSAAKKALLNPRGKREEFRKLRSPSPTNPMVVAAGASGHGRATGGHSNV